MVGHSYCESTPLGLPDVFADGGTHLLLHHIKAFAGIDHEGGLDDAHVVVGEEAVLGVEGFRAMAEVGELEDQGAQAVLAGGLGQEAEDVMPGFVAFLGEDGAFAHVADAAKAGLFLEDLKSTGDLAILMQGDTDGAPAFDLLDLGPHAGLLELAQGGRLQEGIPGGISEGGGK